MNQLPDNPTRGVACVEINGEPLELRFDWDALARLHQLYGEEPPDLSDPHALAVVAALGFARSHPEWDAARLVDYSPPLIEVSEAVNRALAYAYYGGGEPDAKKKTWMGKMANVVRLTWMRRMIRRSTQL